MPLRPNAVMIFDSYRVTDGAIELTFLCPDPGPEQDSYYIVLLTDTELAAVTTQQQLRDLVTAKLGRKLRATNIASKLASFIGQSVTV